ncbi:UNVERIFIED_CONTAM: hypothetical protein RMT77_001331 [Armadillidium vulgare]
MWRLTSTLLLVTLAFADPQLGLDYLPPTTYLPQPKCDDLTSVVYSTSVFQSFIPTTIQQFTTEYITTTAYSQRIVPTTQYRTQYQTIVQYETIYVQRQSQVVRDQVITSTQQAPPVVQTRYITSTRVIPQVSYVVREQVETQVVPVELTNTRYETRYEDQLQYRTVPVESTSYVRVSGRDVVSTAYSTQIQSSVVQKQQPAQTQYRQTTLINNQIETRTVPSPPVVSTQYVQSQRVIPTTAYNTQVQTQYVTTTQYVTRTQYQTRTEVQTQYVSQEVVVTRDVPREVVRTEYRTQVVPSVQLQTRYQTQARPGNDVYLTRQAYDTSIVRIPGEDRVVTREVVNTQYQQQVVYRTQDVQRAVTVTRTVNIPCAQTRYNYQEPQIGFNY